MIDEVRIVPLTSFRDAAHGLPGWLAQGLNGIFYEASNTKVFASETERARFHERWLGRYLEHDAPWAHIALAPSQVVAGYVVGDVDDPAQSPRYADIGYLEHWGALTRDYPAHLHINLAPAYRGCGLGSRLIGTFIAGIAGARCPGVHVVTSRGARNVAFYERNGFIERGKMPGASGEIVFLGRNLPLPP